MVNEWRPEELYEERLRRIADNVSPNLLGGYSPNPTLVPDTGHSGPSETVRGIASRSAPQIKHFAETLKEAAVALATDDRYEMTHVPLPYWPIVLVDGITQDYGTDYTVDGAFLVVLAAMDLIVAETLFVHYDYTFGTAPTDAFGDIETLVDYAATGWKYLQVASGDTTDRSAIGFDDSAWSTGQAAFGHGSPGGGIPSDWHTVWGIIGTNTRLWLRRTIPVGEDYTVYIDNVDDSADVWWNGTSLGTMGGFHPSALAVPSSAVVDNDTQVLAVRATDVNPNGSYVDVKVTGRQLTS